MYFANHVFFLYRSSRPPLFLPPAVSCWGRSPAVTWASAAGPEKEVAIKDGCSVLPSSDLPSSRPLTLLLSPGWEKRELLPYLSHCMFQSFPYSSLPHITFPGLVLNSRKKAKPHVHRGLIVYTHHLQPMPISPSLSGLPWTECISLPWFIHFFPILELLPIGLVCCWLW